MNDKEIYFAIMNILDYMALHEELSHDNQNKLIEICYSLLPFLDGDSNQDKIAAMADANDCGDCSSFSTMVFALRELHKKAERI